MKRHLTELKRKAWLAPATALLVLLSVALLWLSDGNAVVALLPLAGLVVAAAVAWLPLRYTCLAVLFLGLIVDNPAERPGNGRWQTPLLFPGRILCLPLDKGLGLPGVKFYGIEFIYLVVLTLAALRYLTGDPVDGNIRRHSSGTIFLRLTAGGAAALLLWFVWGAAQSGDMAQAMAQMRYMLQLVLYLMLFSYAWRHRSDAKAVMTIVVVTAVLRALVGTYYWYTIARHMADSEASGDGRYITTHSDSSLAVVAVIICVAALYHTPSLRSALLSLAALPPILWGIVINNRRVAMVDLALGLVVFYLLVDRVRKRRVHATLLAMAPVLLLYVGAAWNSPARWAGPIRNLRSVSNQTDGSSEYRDQENTNLIFTAKQHPLLGSGFGHEFVEFVKLADISRLLPGFRYMPHNSLLGLLCSGGVLGFTCVWLYLPVGVFLAARLYRLAKNSTQQLLALQAIVAVVCYMVQAFGDMGLSSMMSSLLVASSLALVASQPAAHEVR